MYGFGDSVSIVFIMSGDILVADLHVRLLVVRTLDTLRIIYPVSISTH